MRVRNKELRGRRHRKEKKVKAIIKALRSGQGRQKSRPSGKSVAPPAKKKTVAKKAAPKKSAAAKKTAAKSGTAKKPATTKAPAKKPATTKAPAKKAVAKKAPAKSETKGTAEAEPEKTAGQVPSTAKND